jgi:gliding motility-associated-like protein
LKGLKLILFFIAALGLNNIIANQGDTIVNKYAKVIELFNSNSKDEIDSLRIHVEDTVHFNVGDTVVIHQAKGVDWRYDYPGVVKDDTGFVAYWKACSWFEYRIIAERIKDIIIFHGNLYSTKKFKYDIRFGVQLIKVATAKTYTVSKTLTAPCWNDSTGGILAIIADTLDLYANIDLTGKGFRGADPGTIKSKATCSAGTLSHVKRNYTLSASDSAGLKGESLVIFDTTFRRGMERLYTGGGGGNNRFAGGGGGSNCGSGGIGGAEEYECIPDHDYSLRNKRVSGQGGQSILQGIIFEKDVVAVFGGGGGCSTQDSVYYASKGGNGGGGIMLIVNVLRTNGNNLKIAANGESVSTSSLAGGGGGGGGGTLLLDINKCIGNLAFEAKGGSGGSTHDTIIKSVRDTIASGPGGGGGGGYIIHNKNFNINNAGNVYAGDKGYVDAYLSDLIYNYASAGNSGTIKNSLVMPVTDFLFNFVPWKMQICAGEKPDTFKASRPKGGFGDSSYSYIWYKSRDQVHWDTVAYTMEYKETTPLDSTTFYKRTVFSIGKQDTIIDASSGITTVIVHPKLFNDSIYVNIREVCKGVALPYIHSYKSPEGGTGYFTYQWQDSTKKWTDAPVDSKNLEYQPTQTDTVHLRRATRSGACVSYSNIVTVNVLDSIDNNKIFKDQWILKGNNPLPITASIPEKGNDEYSYLWQEKNVSSSWGKANGIVDQVNYTIPIPFYNENTHKDTTCYRRIVYSGQDSTCRDTSTVLIIYALDTLKNNHISGNDTICGHTSPDNFSGTQFSGADKKVYIYKWEKSRDSVHWEFSDSIKELLYNPGLLDSSLYFRRIIISSPTDCIKDTSETIFVLVKPQIKNNIIDRKEKDTVICYDQSPGIIKAFDPSGGEGAGTYQYTWQVSRNKIDFKPASGDSSLKDYYSVKLFDTTYIRRNVTSGHFCTSYSDTFEVDVLASIDSNFVTSDQLICNKSIPSLLIGKHPVNGDKINYRFAWLMSTGNDNWTDTIANNTDTSYQPSAIYGDSYFKRVVISGPKDCCKDTSNIVSVKIHDLPTAAMLSFNDSICLRDTFRIPINLTGTEDFELTYLSNTDTNTQSNVKLINGRYDLAASPLDPGVYNYSIIKVIDGNGCVTKEISGNGTLMVFRKPDSHVGRDTAVCGVEALLAAVPSVGTGIWISDDYAVFTDSSAPSTKVTIDDFTGADFKLNTFLWTETNGVCSDTASTRIIFYKQPEKPDAGSDTAASFLFNTNLNAKKPAVGSAVWTTPDNSIIIDDTVSPTTPVSKLKMGENTFIWTVYNEVCTPLSDSVVISALDIRIPQGFSPNRDSVNDYFKIKGLERISNANLTIFNVAGVEVFHSSNYNNKWYGTRNGNALPDDTYFYILNVRGRTYKGFVTIRR